MVDVVLMAPVDSMANGYYNTEYCDFCMVDKSVYSTILFHR